MAIGFMAYRRKSRGAPPDFLGNDVLMIEVRYPEGRTEIQKITVNVSGVVRSRKFRVTSLLADAGWQSQCCLPALVGDGNSWSILPVKR